MSPPSSHIHTFPGSQALQLVTLLQRWEIGADVLLEGTGLSAQDLEAPDARLASDTMRDLYLRARKLTGEPGIGVYLGLQKRLTMYGFLGFATMSAATLGESIELTARYAPTLSTALSFELVVVGREAQLFVHEHIDMGAAHDIAVFSLVVGHVQLSAALLGQDLGPTQIDIPFARPDYFGRFEHLLPNARFGARQVCFRFNQRALDLPLVNPDRAALRLAREACERQLCELGFDRDLCARVRRVACQPEGFLTADAAAHALHMSSRTLKRRLADLGTTFSALMDEERRSRALRLLRSQELSLDEVANRLGYASGPNFARAFRRWTGMSPGRYRKRGQ